MSRCVAMCWETRAPPDDEIVAMCSDRTRAPQDDEIQNKQEPPWTMLSLRNKSPLDEEQTPARMILIL